MPGSVVEGHHSNLQGRKKSMFGKDDGYLLDIVTDGGQREFWPVISL